MWHVRGDLSLGELTMGSLRVPKLMLFGDVAGAV